MCAPERLYVAGLLSFDEAAMYAKKLIHKEHRDSAIVSRVREYVQNAPALDSDRGTAKAPEEFGWIDASLGAILFEP